MPPKKTAKKATKKKTESKKEPVEETIRPTTRLCKEGFLKTYLNYVQKTEVPDYFGMWCGISLISICLNRKCQLANHWPLIFPNMYVILVAGSALQRKSTAIGQAMHLLYQLDDQPIVLAQKMTTEALIGSLSGTLDTMTASGKLASKDLKAQAIIVADELSVFLDREANTTGLIPFLTNIWDTQQGDFEYRTRARNVERLVDPYICLLAGTTVDWLRHAIPEDAVGGGFSSRVIFVTCEKSERVVPWPHKDAEVVEMEERLIHDLTQIRRLSGGFDAHPDAYALYCQLYKEFQETSHLVHDKNLQGYAGRRHVMLMKLAMIHSASQSNSMIVELNDMETANAILEQTEVRMPTITQMLTSTDAGEQLDFVRGVIEKAGQLNRTELIRKVSHKLKARDLDDILSALVQGGYIDAIHNGPRRMEYKYIRG
ncbi:MAG: hypothetical protein Unbinned400contig1000_33 [Prokaryotic dsDNA virus sp.]|nr:MAG: hypothetical protein Unbinned400contig1000_33 [Prokaryotic dsDNA virus sp.]